jgi:hypothetical protein
VVSYPVNCDAASRDGRAMGWCEVCWNVGGGVEEVGAAESVAGLDGFWWSSWVEEDQLISMGWLDLEVRHRCMFRKIQLLVR